ncbi:hypothetical protein [Pontibacter beigongshangensis]|uniref:hypothetical protein n=1 Tax=Pontibacter beigongshangensis TaxID=2574733 RepID=UPI00164FE246|nr:hypothetical protein [Pontibacter beigongshangensis]
MSRLSTAVLLSLLMLSCAVRQQSDVAQVSTAAQKGGWSSKFVSLNPDGGLRYHPDEKGNVIPDFSRVGYHQGNKEIPVLPVVKTIRPPGSGSSQEIIQRAIDEVSALQPDKAGFRGAILLKKGDYLIPGSLHIRAGGIVLRGEGDEAGGTRLVATGKGKRSLLQVTGTGSLVERPGTRTPLTDAFVPTGAMSVRVAAAAIFKAGDRIILYRPGTTRWITDIRMNQIEAREGTKQWEPQQYDLHFERVITSINGNEVFLDNPVVMEMESRYGGGEIYGYSFEGRISEVGVENICFESEYAGEEDEDHGWIAVDFSKVENGWVKNVTSRYFGFGCVSLGKSVKQVTVQDSKCLDAKSRIWGGRRYSFNNDGQLNLFRDLQTTEGRHDFVTGAMVLGPNVFYNCTATNAHSDIGPHHRWSAGTLYDNISTDGEINVQDRGNWGTGHGWAGVTQVLWNCQAKKATVQSPWASGRNYSIGLQGQQAAGRLAGRPVGEWEGLNQPGLQPASLYLSQLKARKKEALEERL